MRKKPTFLDSSRFFSRYFSLEVFDVGTRGIELA